MMESTLKHNLQVQLVSYCTVIYLKCIALLIGLHLFMADSAAGHRVSTSNASPDSKQIE